LSVADCALGVFAGEQTDETTVGRRDGQVAELLLAHPYHHRLQARARPDGAWARRHGLFGRDVRAAADCATADPAEDDAPVVDDEAGVPAALVELPADLFEAVVEAAGWYVRADVSARTGLAAVLPLER